MRAAVVHVVGDTRGNVKHAAESFMAEYLYGTNMSYAERLKQVLSTGSLRGDDITLTLDSSLCAYAASLFPQDQKRRNSRDETTTRAKSTALQSFPNHESAIGQNRQPSARRLTAPRAGFSAAPAAPSRSDHLGRRIAKPAPARRRAAIPARAAF